MRKQVTLVAALLMTGSYRVDAAVPEGLVKITGKANVACVEYYSYQGESYCSTKALGSEKVDPAVKTYETQIIQFDDRPWQAAWGKNTEQDVTVEYVPMGDNINDWHELVTSQYFPGIQDKVTPKKLAEMIIDGMKKAGYDPIVTFHQESADEVLFEFRIEKPESQQQDELQIIRRGKTGMYVIHYAIKVADMPEKTRALWIKNLTSSTIK